MPVSAHWCKQMEPGTYRLRIGTRGAAVCVAPDAGLDPDDAALSGCRDYFTSMPNGWVSAAALPGGGRPWTLEVVRLSAPRGPNHPSTSGIRITAPWCLDVDEDFFDCRNPFKDKVCDALRRTGRKNGAARDTTDGDWKVFYRFNDPEEYFLAHHRRVQQFWTQAPWRGMASFQRHPSVRWLGGPGGVDAATLHRMRVLAPRLRGAFTDRYLCDAGMCVGLPSGSAVRL